MTTDDAGPAWSAWTQVTPVVVARAASAPYVRVQLPLSISPGANGDFADLRVIDDRGAERPYALDPQAPQFDDRAVPLIDVGFVPRRGTQGVVDLGTSGELVDAVTLEVDAARRPTYFERVAIDASDDRRTWRIVRADAIVYRVEQDAGRGNTTLTFPPTRSRWVRVRVLDPSAAFPLTGALAGSATPAQPSLVRVPVEPRENDDAATHEQTWTFAPAVPVRATEVTFTDGGARYERPVTVEASDDAKTWTALGDGTIAHYAEGGSRTNVSLIETTARYVRVTVRNGNDAPLRALRPVLLVRPHALVFAGGGQHRLLSGNPSASAPTYDLAARLSHERWRAADAATGMTAPNAGYRDPRPLGERFPWLLTGALLAAAVALGVVALRSLRPASAQ
jgi:hypothetical protein